MKFIFEGYLNEIIIIIFNFVILNFAILNLHHQLNISKFIKMCVTSIKLEVKLPKEANKQLQFQEIMYLYARKN